MFANAPLCSGLVLNRENGVMQGPQLGMHHSPIITLKLVDNIFLPIQIFTLNGEKTPHATSAATVVVNFPLHNCPLILFFGVARGP